MWRVDGKFLEYWGMHMLCRTIEDAKFIIDRSAAAELNISYNSNNKMQPDYEVLVFILVKYSSRIRSLDVSSIIYELPGNPPHLPELSALKQLTFRLFGCERSARFIEAILLSAPRLGSIVISKGVDYPVAEQRLSSLLRALGSVSSYINQQNNMLYRLRRLEILKGCSPRWPNAFTPSFTLLHITSIALSCRPQHLLRMKLPALREFDWEVQVESGSQDADSYLQPWKITFPSLKTLKVTAPNAMWLSRMSLPNLRKLSWANDILAPGHCLPFPSVRLDSVETLSCDANCDDSVFISALECTPNAHTVVFAPGDHIHCPEEWGKSLLGYIAEQALTTHSELRHLTLGTDDHLVTTRRSVLNPIIQKIIKSKKYSGVPIQHFKVFWQRTRKMEIDPYPYRGSGVLQDYMVAWAFIEQYIKERAE